MLSFTCLQQKTITTTKYPLQLLGGRSGAYALIVDDLLVAPSCIIVAAGS